MKNLLLLLALCICSTLIAQNECKPYIPISQGSTWEITNYSAKDKEMGKTTFELAEKVTSGGVTTFTVNSVSYDKKGKEIFKNSFEARCENGKFVFDMAFKMNGASMQTYQDMEIDVDASDFEIPDLNADAGTKLEDGTIRIGIGGGGPGISMNIAITDRVVEKRESYTSPAGTFDCVVLAQKVSTKMVVNVEASSKEWYAENVGIVRTESYSKSGKLTGYSLLTKLNVK